MAKVKPQPIEVTLAENWAHDNLTERQYEDDQIRDLAVRAYVAGFQGVLS